MSDSAAALSVSIQELSPVHVAYLTYHPNAESTDMHAEIGACFRRVQTWVRELGHDPFTLTVGAVRLVNGQLASYDCCAQVPADVTRGSDGVDIQDLPGGRYAVLSIVKDPQIIGPAIGRFHQEYVPQQNLTLDGARPTYEIYDDKTMQYCVPIF
jgi:DNA gyrase inhibitor GyrI